MSFNLFILDNLCLSPSKEKFQRSLTTTLKGIPAVLCAKAVPMDGAIGGPPPSDEESIIDNK